MRDVLELPDGTWELSVVIDCDGNAEAEVNGIHGGGCDKIMALVDALGEVTEHRHTADFDKRPVRAAQPGHRQVRTGRK